MKIVVATQRKQNDILGCPWSFAMRPQGRVGTKRRAEDPRAKFGARQINRNVHCNGQCDNATGRWQMSVGQRFAPHSLSLNGQLRVLNGQEGVYEGARSQEAYGRNACAL